MGKKLKFETSGKKEKINFLGDAKDTFVNNAHIEIFAEREISVDGCLGVLEFTDSLIKLNLKKGYVMLIGKNLDIKSFEGDSILIGGSLSGLELLVSKSENDKIL